MWCVCVVWTFEEAEPDDLWGLRVAVRLGL